MNASLEQLVATLKHMQTLPEGNFIFERVEGSAYPSEDEASHSNRITTIEYVRHYLNILVAFIENHTFDHLPEDFDTTLNTFNQSLQEFTQWALTPRSDIIEYTPGGLAGSSSLPNRFKISKLKLINFRVLCESILAYLHNCADAQTPEQLRAKYLALQQESSRLEALGATIRKRLSTLEKEPSLRPEELAKIKATREALLQWDNARKYIEDSLTTITEIQNAYKKHYEEFTQDTDTLRKAMEHAQHLNERIADLEQRNTKLTEDLEKNLSEYSSLSLGESFIRRKKELEDDERKQYTRINWSIVLIIGINFYNFLLRELIFEKVLPKLGINVSQFYTEHLTQIIITTELLVIPFLWLIWLASKRILHISQLKEDYAFKAATASSYIAYEQTATKIDSTLRRKLLEILITRFNEHPLKIADRETPSSPLHEFAKLLGSRAFLKDGGQLLKDFESSITSILDAADRFMKSFKDLEETTARNTGTDRTSETSAPAEANNHSPKAHK